MNTAPGARIFERVDALNPDVVEVFRRFSSGNVSDGMKGFGTMDHGIKPMWNCGKIVGPAVTLKLTIGDSLLVCKTIEVAQPGDVIVIDAHGTLDNAVWGDIRSLASKVKGLAGVVVDGAVRDIEGIRETGFPVFARSLTCRSSSKNNRGEINVPVCCGGVAVHPGDLIVGDEGGVVAVPPELIDEVKAFAEKKLQSEEKMRQEALSGTVIPESFLKQMAALGY